MHTVSVEECSLDSAFIGGPGGIIRFLIRDACRIRHWHFSKCGSTRKQENFTAVTAETIFSDKNEGRFIPVSEKISPKKLESASYSSFALAKRESGDILNDLMGSMDIESAVMTYASAF